MARACIMMAGMDNEGSFDQGEREQGKPNSENGRRKERVVCSDNRVAGKLSSAGLADRRLPPTSSLLNVLVEALVPSQGTSLSPNQPTGSTDRSAPTERKRRSPDWVSRYFWVSLLPRHWRWGGGGEAEVRRMRSPLSGSAWLGHGVDERGCCVPVTAVSLAPWVSSPSSQ